MYCGQTHFSASCENVRDISHWKNVLLRYRCCFVCLKVGHRSKECKVQRQCRNCGNHHHQSICQREYHPPNNPGPRGWNDNGSDRKRAEPPEPPKQENDKMEENLKTGEQIRTVTGTVRCKNENLLKTATVLAENLNGLKTMPVRLLLDDGSQKSYIQNHVRTELNLQTIKTQNVYLNTFGNEKYNKQKLDVVKLKLKGRFNGYSTEVEITAMCVPSTCSL